MKHKFYENQNFEKSLLNVNSNNERQCTIYSMAAERGNFKLSNMCILLFSSLLANVKLFSESIPHFCVKNRK